MVGSGTYHPSSPLLIFSN
jgi:hypothetical protein